MATTGRPEADSPTASGVAERLRGAGFVRLIAAPDGDGLAATGLLAGALASTPYQASVAPTAADAARTTDADLTVAVGRPAGAADLTLDAPASRLAYDVATDLGGGDPVLALAGMVAAGVEPQGTPLEDATAAGLDRRPGVGVPTSDPVDGLAHSTLVHAGFSGDREAVADLLAGIDRDGSDEATRRTVASLVALAVAGDEAGGPRATEAAERIFRPYVGGPFETVAGYADVLDALARERPGLGIALAVGSGDREAALSAWRDHGTRAHAAVDAARTGRYDGLFVARCEAGPVGTVARLVHDYRSPEPVTLVVADGEAAVVADDETDAGATAREAAAAVGGSGDGTATRARARFDADDSEFVLAVREAQ
jgi:hypothetical protein